MISKVSLLNLAVATVLLLMVAAPTAQASKHSSMPTIHPPVVNFDSSPSSSSSSPPGSNTPNSSSSGSNSNSPSSTTALCPDQTPVPSSGICVQNVPQQQPAPNLFSCPSGQTVDLSVASCPPPSSSAVSGGSSSSSGGHHSSSHKSSSSTTNKIATSPEIKCLNDTIASAIIDAGKSGALTIKVDKAGNAISGHVDSTFVNDTLTSVLNCQQEQVPTRTSTGLSILG